MEQQHQTTKIVQRKLTSKKTYQTEVDKPMTFNFEATQVKETTRDDLVKTNLSCTIPSISFATDDFTSESGTYTKLSEKITFGTLTEAGKYEYTVKESATTTQLLQMAITRS